MKDKDGFYIGRDSGGLFKWNEKVLIRIEEPKPKKKQNEKSPKRSTGKNFRD
ncbi:hypothetical protein SAMN05421866_4189 [Chryseobacterium oranimense]|uniref:Uncharacterized protein n=1 Tax=Chryseobacterium oranimense TaxID=421058 RepID=A0A1M5WQV6_9FLAO|nr:hypothetical protein SAMN05421866_4189 [Chryseobacterium oranimense]